MVDPDYTCSSSFNDTGYAMAAICPTLEGPCKDKSLFQFNRENDIDIFQVDGLKKGQACTYEIQGRCGAPSFALKEISNVTKDIVKMQFIEWNSDTFDNFKNVEVTMPYDKYQPFFNNVTMRYEQTYQLFMANRNFEFADSGDNGKSPGQF